MQKYVYLVLIIFFTTLSFYPQNLHRQLQQEHQWENAFFSKPAEGNLYRDSSITYRWINSSWVIQTINVFQYSDNYKRHIVFNKEFKNGAWQDMLKVTNDFDTFGNIITITTELPDGASWKPVDQKQIKYNETGKEVEQTMLTWNNGWQFYARYITEYNENQEETLYLYQEWDGEWKNNFRYLYTYNASGELLEYTGQIWDTDWKNFEMANSTGMVDNKIITTLFNWTDTAWTGHTRLEEMYNQNNLLISKTTSTRMGNGWQNSRLDEFVYDEISGRELQRTSYNWNNDNWINFTNVLKEYTSEGNLLYQTYQEWVNNNWLNRSRNIFQKSDNTEEFILQSWSDGSWVNISRLVDKYFIPSSVDKGIIASGFSLAQNYPNPFNPVTTFRFTLPAGATVILKIFDVLGKEVKTVLNEYRNAGTHEIKFDAASLGSGNYFYTLAAGNLRQSKKLTLLK